MVSILSGKIGAGKTLHAVELMYEALCEGRVVGTNVELVYSALAALALKEKSIVIKKSQLILLTSDNIWDWHTLIPWGVVGSPSLVCLDEIHLWFNSRDYAKTDKLHRDMLSFLSQSRKACVDVIFIAQEITNIEKQFRNQAKNLIFISFFGGFYLPVLGRVPLQQNVIVTRDADTKMVMRTQKRQYPKKMFGCYETLAFLDDRMKLAADDMVRVEPLKFIKIKASEKKELLARLEAGENLDSFTPFRPPSLFSRIIAFIRFFFASHSVSSSSSDVLLGLPCEGFTDSSD